MRQSYSRLCYGWQLPGFSIFLAGLLTFASCSQENGYNSSPLAISNRSLTIPDQKLLMVSLKRPALLQDAPVSEKGVMVSAQALAAVKEEQEGFLKILSGVAPKARVLWRYKFVLNGMALVVPSGDEEKIKALSEVRDSHQDLPFFRPDTMEGRNADEQDLNQQNSAIFIGAGKVRGELKVDAAAGKIEPVDGKGIRVGIIDTGVDYTHQMLGGSGSPEDYEKALNSANGAGFFPNNKVVGGVDLVGRDYDPGSSDPSKRLPKSGSNPIDEHGHGTHVAGTVAGIGNGRDTYTGVAPGALLYPIKVFGRIGSTTDSVVLAALEYAVDPLGTDDPSNHLDVVNLSLGSRFGLPHSLYDEAIKNLIRAKVTPVISAGNSGDIPYVVSSPGVGDDAISVAASVDDMDHNWKFKALEFRLPTEESLSVEFTEASFTKPAEESSDASGKLIFVGHAVSEPSNQLKKRLHGHVALVDRGEASFFEKISRVWEAGATGCVVINDRPGPPVPMDGGGDLPLPAVMISQEVGDRIRLLVEQGSEVEVSFGSSVKIEKPELVDRITAFSSRGPRSLDSVIKPEISAPGQNIISARVGSGVRGVAFSGTSMAAPHISGVVALLKQYRNGISEEGVRSSLLGSGKLLRQGNEGYESVARQGAGRVQAWEALNARIITDPAALSLGEYELSSKKVIRRTVEVRNTSNAEMIIRAAAEVKGPLRVWVIPDQVNLSGNGHVVLDIFAQMEAPADDRSVEESFGWISLNGRSKAHENEIRIPLLAVAVRQSQVKARPVRIHSGPGADSRDAMAELELKNHSRSPGEALLFNLLARDKRKEGIGPLQRYPDICDLEAVGYRVVYNRQNGQKIPILQIAAKLFSPMTTWNHCEISVQIDGSGNGTTDQELLGTDLHLLSSSYKVGTFKSVLTDAHQMRVIRAEYDRNGGSEDYLAAMTDIRDLKLYHHGTLAVLSARLDRLARGPSGLIKIKVASLVTSAVLRTGDDFLRDHESRWELVDPCPRASPFYDLPEVIHFAGHESKAVFITRGEADGRLIAFFPRNPVSRSVLRKDLQSQILSNKYLF